MKLPCVCVVLLWLFHVFTQRERERTWWEVSTGLDNLLSIIYNYISGLEILSRLSFVGLVVLRYCLVHILSLLDEICLVHMYCFRIITPSILLLFYFIKTSFV